jgi:hypothetical protein
MTIVVRKDGTTYNLKELGIRTKDFIVSSPSYRHETENIEGGDGVVDLGTTLDTRSITCIFKMVATDISEVPLLRNEVFRIFNSKESFYLIDEREPGKRWEVKCDNSYTIAQQFIYGDFQVDFIAYTGMAESVNNTLNMVVAQISGNKEQKYKHTTSAFEILNDGDNIINPRKSPLLIEFKGASTNLQIKNLTTGDTWTYTGTTTASDNIKLDGIRSTKNGLSIFRDSNRKLITLAPGWNEIELLGASGTFEISFDFRFYTL